MINAIVYTTNTGYTAEYAQLLSKETGLPAYSLTQAKGKLSNSSEIVYLGWLMASKVQGYKKAAATYQVKAVCGVGMGGTGTQLEEVRKGNVLPDDLPVFTLQGGFDMNKLHGIYKFMMKIMKAMLGGKLEKKSNRTEDENAMLDMLNNGASYVSEKSLSDVLRWYRSH